MTNNTSPTPDSGLLQTISIIIGAIALLASIFIVTDLSWYGITWLFFTIPVMLIASYSALY